MVGGKGFGITQSPDGVLLTWQGGSAQGGYLLARLSGQSLGTGVFLGPLLAGTTSYLDTTAPTGPVCYALFPVVTNPQAISDLLCVMVGSHSVSGAPSSFTLRMNQSTTASFTWGPPLAGGQDGYLLVPLGGSAQVFGATASSANIAAIGLSCYVLGALSGGQLIGYTDVLCGMPGFSNLGSVIGSTSDS
jgi:hypothetical protein